MNGEELVERLALSLALALRREAGELGRLVQDQEQVGAGATGLAEYVALRALALDLEPSLFDELQRGARALADRLVAAVAGRLAREPDARRREAARWEPRRAAIVPLSDLRVVRGVDRAPAGRRRALNAGGDPTT